LPGYSEFQRGEVSAFRQGQMSIDIEGGGETSRTDRVIGRRNSSDLTEIALHYENGGVVAEANFPRELCGTLKNAGPQRFR
jgi:hypothetical protein